MALAILQYIDAGPDSIQFRIDIGTNQYYKFRIGKTVAERSGIKWVDGELYATPFKKKRNDTDVFDTSEEIALPASYFREACYLQLLSCKDLNGRAPAVSKVLKFNAINTNTANTRGMQDIETKNHSTLNMMFNRPRNIALSYDSYVKQASWEDVVSTILRAAVPVAVNLLSGTGGAAAGTTGAPAASGSAGSTGAPGATGGGTAATGGTAGAITSLLQTVLNAISRSASVSTQQSVPSYSEAFIFGIDDALLATLAGPIIQQGIQALPQLLNSVNQHRLQTLQANNQLMTNLANGVNQRLMMQQLAQSQPSGTTLTPEQITQLMQMIQQAQAAAPAVAQSLSLGSNVSAAMSNSVVISFDTEPELQWNNTAQHIYKKGQPITLSVRLNVNPAPKTPLPRAIFKICFKDVQDQKVVFEKIFRQKNIAANTAIDLSFTQDELNNIPAQKPLTIFAEARWISGKTQKRYKAVGSMNAVFVNECFFKSRGNPVQDEKELSDMNVYRAFWNKIWESPVLSHSGGSGKSLWQLDVTGKYLVGIDTVHGSNALMETKLMRQPNDPGSLTDLAAGKMKAGIELSVDELNKLCSLWAGGQPLSPTQLEALKTDAFAKDNAMQMTFNIRLKGRARERGLVWVIPTFRVFELLLQQADKTNEKGQVTQISEHKVLFPLPVNARLIGLKSK